VRSSRKNQNRFSVAVAIATYQRPQGLRTLLDSLKNQQGISFPWHIIVVDNDAEESGRVVVEAFGSSNPPLDYLVEHDPGIPAARNRAIHHARQHGIDAVAFIDDDEWASPLWLTTLVNRIMASGADAVSGPVEPIFPGDAPEWAYGSRLFHRSTFPDGASLDYASTANSILRLDAISGIAQPFDPSFRFTGGSDSFLYQSIRTRGKRIIWEPNALVYEEVPLSRITTSWILQRSYRQGITLARCDHLVGKPWYRLLYRGMRGVTQFPLGAFDITLGLVKCEGRWRRGLTRIARGAGVLAGLFGATYDEYWRDD
jgi:succinoglycan biosynthesis protein ExoM